MTNMKVFPMVVLALLSAGTTAMEQSNQIESPRIELDIDCAFAIHAALEHYVAIASVPPDEKRTMSGVLKIFTNVQCGVGSNTVRVRLVPAKGMRGGAVSYAFDRKTMELKELVLET